MSNRVSSVKELLYALVPGDMRVVRVLVTVLSVLIVVIVVLVIMNCEETSVFEDVSSLHFSEELAPHTTGKTKDSPLDFGHERNIPLNELDKNVEESLWQSQKEPKRESLKHLSSEIVEDKKLVIVTPEKLDNLKTLQAEPIPVTITDTLAGTKQTKQDSYQPLGSEVINRIKKFVFFIGSARSGHSIVGSLLDAHPHVVISNEFFLFKKWTEIGNTEALNWTSQLYNALYKESFEDASSQLKDSNKGYTLRVDGLWQGRFKEYIEVIGDKSAGMTTAQYFKNKNKFVERYQTLKKKLSIPILAVHVVRNPFDIISSDFLYKGGGKELLKNFRFSNISSSDKANNEDLLRKKVDNFFQKNDANSELIDTVLGKENVLEIHNCDLVRDPRGTLSKLLDFLEVEATESYLNTCADKVFKTVSHSRDLVVWPSEVKAMVEDRMRRYKMLDRYSFTSD